MAISFLIVVISATTAVAFTTATQKKFSSQSRIFVNISSGPIAQISQGANLRADTLQLLQQSIAYTNLRANTYLELINLDSAVQKLTQAMGYQVTTNDYYVVDLPQTNIFEVHAFAGTARNSAKLANLVTDEFVSTIKHFESVGNNGGSFVPISTTVLQGASTPVSPLSPLPKRNILLGIYIGFALRFLWLVIKSNGVKLIIDAESVAQIAGLNCLGVLPTFNQPENTGLWDLRSENVWNNHLEQIRTSLLHNLGASKSVLITSIKPGEGKTFIAVNLAESISQLGMSVCFLDADLRTEVDEKIIFRNPVGEYTDVQDLLSGVVTAEKIPQSKNSVTYILNSTRILEPNELILDIKFKVLLSELCTYFDVVIVDSPALAGSSDANLLASVTDSTVLITRCNFLKPSQLENGLKSLGRVHVAPIGFIFSMADSEYSQEEYYKNHSERLEISSNVAHGDLR